MAICKKHQITKCVFIKRDGATKYVCGKCQAQRKQFLPHHPFEKGQKCSKNMVFVSSIRTLDELLNRLINDKSIFWRHRPFPCAFLYHQPLVVLINSLNRGELWEIKQKETI